MNTFNNMAQAAAKAVWGENDKKQEPVSGQLGDVSKGEPYDAGNIEPQQTEQKPESKIEEQPEPKVEEHPESKIEETKQEPETGTEVNPAETKESSIVPGDSTKAQNDTRDPSNPQTDPEAAKAKENINDASTGLDTDDDPVKVEGPGPKPVQELAKENGGDAGNRSSTDSQKSAGEDSAVSGVDDEEEDGPQKTSHGTGTGEIYIKSTGLKADGGDFDAARAGAGREADRLLEEKGIKSTSSPKSGSSDTLESKPSSTGKEKVSLKDKIKSKLHKTPVS